VVNPFCPHRVPGVASVCTLLQKVRAAAADPAPPLKTGKTIHLRRGNVERPVLPQRQRIRPDQNAVVNHRLKRRVESVRRSLRRIEPQYGVELPVRQINAPLRVRFQATHFALVAQVLDRRGHGGVGLGEI